MLSGPVTAAVTAPSVTPARRRRRRASVQEFSGRQRPRLDYCLQFHHIIHTAAASHINGRSKVEYCIRASPARGGNALAECGPLWAAAALTHAARAARALPAAPSPRCPLHRPPADSPPRWEVRSCTNSQEPQNKTFPSLTANYRRPINPRTQSRSPDDAPRGGGGGGGGGRSRDSLHIYLQVELSCYYV
ncbi:hypothetical protein JYU34_007850 [Plutella xylostella]|uniref:Uncharacterized protein n=1 Tax=Plutella xylostella TaxID=51655 RepID=A0ABQ7QRF6_PLUXY|nr:hypothetical protein JYU34_007850 [Plutella xylostella]